MYKEYNIKLFDGQTYTDLTYSLNDSLVSQIWASLMTQVSPKNIKPHSNPWRGILKDWDKKVNELNELIASLNTWIPKKIEDVWDDNDPNESLNKLHIHFPELEKSETDIDHIIQLGRYNDLIHEMQSLNDVRNTNKEYMQLIICPDSSKIEHLDIPENCFKEFEHKFYFGDLVLHYCHVGRHPYEVFISNDTTIPGDQIIPQKSIYTYHSLRFFDIVFSKLWFKKFYEHSKLSWPYTYENPRLAFGYIKLGKLKLVNGKNWNAKDTYELVRNSYDIIEWNVK